MPERKYTSHSAEDCTGLCTKWYIKDGLVETMGSRTYAVKQYKKSEKNGRRS